MGDGTEIEDPVAEVTAIQAVAAALAPLTAAGKVRVLRWAGDLFGAGISPISPRPGVSTRPAPTETSGVASRAVGEFAELAEFYAAASPDTDARKALVVAYWIQVRQGAADVDTQSVNAELKHLGFGIGNITRAFEALKEARPQLVHQLRKEGSTRQARKKFKVTVEGQREVERMISTAGAG